MKAAILCSSPNASWPKEYFPDICPYMLPVLGKPIIEFYLEYCSLCGADSVMIIIDELFPDIDEFVMDGSRWGLKTEFLIRPKSLTFLDIYKNRKDFFKQDEVVVMSGLFFPLYNKNAEKKEWKKVSKFARGSRIGGAIGEIELATCDILEVPSLCDYYLLNMNLQRVSDDRLFMAGYSGEKGVHMGMNDVVKSTAKLYPPIIVGDNVQIEYGTHIGNGAIVGSSCIIDARTKVEESVVFDNTYIGTDLKIVGKIVNGGEIVDAKSGVRVSFSDAYFSSSMRYNQADEFLKRSCAEVFALMLAPFMMISFIPFLFLGRPNFEYINVPNFAGRTCRLRRYIRSANMRDIWFFKLSLDKLPWLLSAIKWKIALIGDIPLDEKIDSRRIEKYKGRYRAGAFSRSDITGSITPSENFLDDMYYARNRNFMTDVGLVLKSFILRLFSAGGKRAQRN